jgi:RNA polymerase-binding transcription factor DksA
MPRYHTKRMYGPYFPWDHGSKHSQKEIKEWQKAHKISLLQKIKNILKKINAGRA